MRFLIAVISLCWPLSAQTFILQNVSNQDFEALQLFEQRETVIKQVRDLFIAGDTGSYVFDVAAEVCLSLQEELKTDYPTRARVIRASDNTRACRVELTGEKARFMWDGWDWNEPAGGDGAVRTVCASNCDHTTLQAALDVAALGDLIELEAETFGGATTGTIAVIPQTHTWQGYCPTYTVIQTAGYAANFTPGIRVSAADAPNMAHLIGGTDDGPDVEHVIRFEDTENIVAPMSSVDTGTDTFTTSGAHGLNVNDEVLWTGLRLTGDFDEVTDYGLHPFRHYFIKTAPTTTTFTLSETLGGATVDITGTTTFDANVGMRRLNDIISCVRMRGLEIETAAGEVDSQSIISMYDNSADPQHMMSHIILRHLWLHGNDNTSAPKRGINLNGRYLAVRDSLIEEIKQAQGSESYAIEVQNAPGPVWLENNSLSGAGMSIFIGAGFTSAPYANNGVYGGVVSRNDYLWKKPEWYLQRVAETPTIACVDGTQFQNAPSSPTTCYTCTGGSWVADGDCSNAINYEIKNLYEVKTCDRCLAESLSGSLSPFGDGGQQAWLNVKLQPNSFQGWNKVGDFIAHNFRAQYVSSAFVLRGPITTDSVVGGPYGIWNGLITDLDPTIFRYETGVPANRAGQFGSIPEGIDFRHLTVVPRIGAASPMPKTLLIDPDDNVPNVVPLRGLSWRDNIWSTNFFDSDQASLGCPSWDHMTTPTGIANIENNAYLSSGFIVHTTCVTTEYEETSINNFGFADPANGDFRITGAGTTNDYRAGQANDASDGKDMGVDHELLNDALGGFDPTAGLGSWSSQYGVSVTAIGSTTATVEFDRPAANACDLTLYTDYARTIEHADTDTASEKLDSNRDVTAGHVTFTLGANSVLTTKKTYWFEIDCATDSVKMVGSLMMH